jgi:membrane protein YqaA with SNARE-associated domain
LDWIKHAIAKYTGFIQAVLVPLGSFGVFAIAFVDSAAFGIPLDPVVVGWVYAHPQKWWLYALMASSGSALGSSFLWWVGIRGGEPLLEKRFGKVRMEQMRDRFEKQEFVALAGASMLPPPTPFKLFVLAAGVFDMRLKNFLAAVFVGRMVRFTIVSFLTIRFGPQIVQVTRNLLLQHLRQTGGVIAALLVLAGLLWYLHRSRKRAPVIREGRD